ncbi:MAG: type III pantothenate kinase [Pirellulaceae bacterium]|nr:type III pantothenate kinase [Pirellulaceae bacterium]
MNCSSESSLLAIDVGNTAIKVGRFHGADHPSSPFPIDVIRLDARSPNFDELRAWLPADPFTCCMASVYRQAAEEIVDWMRTIPSIRRVHQLQHSDFQIPIQVDHPDRVGQDRLANAVAARWAKSSESSAIVVDAGSAITVDLISAAGCFLGGAILAGQQASALALSSGTDLLPVISTYRMDDPPEVVGAATDSAIRSGVFWGAVGSIREIVERMQVHVGSASEIFLTGGDMRRLAPHLAPNAQYMPHLVLSGIALAARSQTSFA